MPSSSNAHCVIRNYVGVAKVCYEYGDCSGANFRRALFDVVFVPETQGLRKGYGKGGSLENKNEVEGGKSLRERRYET